ncbi:hypothetical protein L218DRAFT_876975, partial [Marasmius fiardii PR-910]
SGLDEVELVVGIASCSSTEFKLDAPEMGGIGTIPYDGPWDPKWRSEAGTLPPHQNFTVKIPKDIQKGTTQLSLTP